MTSLNPRTAEETALQSEARWLPPVLRFFSPDQWDQNVRRPLRYWCEVTGPNLRRVTIQLRRWSVRVSSDSPEWIRLAGLDWTPVFGSGQPNVELYVSRDVPEALLELAEGTVSDGRRAYGVIDQTRGLCWVGGVRDYRGVRRAVFEALTGSLAARNRGRGAARVRWIGAPAATVEWPQIPGKHKGVALLGPHALRTVHGFLLARYAEDATLATLDWSFVSPRTGEVLPGDGYLLVPGTFVRLFPSLLSTIVLSESAAPERYPGRNTLLAYQAPEDLDRGIATGEVSSRELASLIEQVAAPDHWLMVDPEQLVGADHLAEQCHVATWVAIRKTPGHEPPWLIRPTTPEAILNTLLSECFAYHQPETGEIARTSLESWLHRKSQRFFELAGTYALLPSHLALRFALAGLIQQARFLTADEVPEDIRTHLALERRDGQWWSRRRAVDVLGLIEGDDRLRYALAIDSEMASRERVEDPFALLLGVWPGQIADFFTQHRFLNPRRLFSSVLPW